MNTAIHYHLAGLGAGSSTVTKVGGTLMATAAATGPAAPLVAIAGAITELFAAFGFGSGCGQTCIETSQWANQAGAQLDQNIAAYFAISPPRPKSAQQQALQNFQTVWNQLVQLCSQANLGDAGKNCISARQAGACHWKAAPPAYPGEPATGTCWNWWNAYYDPIANDTNVYDDSATASASAAGNVVTSAVSNLFGNVNPYLLIGGGLIGLAVLAEFL